MLRALLLWMSRNVTMKRWVMRSRLTRGMVSRFVAGNTLDEATATAHGLVARNLAVTLDHLGESVASEAEADGAGEVYLGMLDRLHREGLKESTVSLKPTQLGLALSQHRCADRIARVVEKSVGCGLSVEIDMEDSPTTDATLEIYEELLKKQPRLRVCLQSYLHRTDRDLQRIIELGGSVRLVKGAYREPSAVAIQKKSQVDAALVRHVHMGLSGEALEKGFYLALASHDERIVKETVAVAARDSVGKERFELQFLYGIRTDLQQSLAARDIKVRIYQPYGMEWYPYFMRRLAERPANLWFLVKNMFRR